MGKNIKVDFKELQELQNSVEKFQETYDTFAVGLAKEITARLLSAVIPCTPKGKYPKGSGKTGGTLRKGWTAAKNSIKIKKMVGMYEIEVTNPTMYADYVESGHRTRGGGGWVPGKFFLQISEEEIQAIAPALVEKRVQQKLEEMMK